MESRPAQPYMGIHFRTQGEAEFRAAADNGFSELFAWLASRNLQPAGAPMIRYYALDDDGFPTDFELGAPVAQAVDGDGRVERRELPAGEYAVLVHVGPFRHEEVPDLRAARERLLAWTRDEGMEVAVEEVSGSLTFSACIESYLTGPDEPDWTRWQTELAYLTS